MAYACLLGRKEECDGCGACDDERIVARCEQCGEDIYEGEDIYDLEGVFLHEECLYEYMKDYRKVAEGAV